MKLTVLGSGSAVFNPKSPYRFPASHLVEATDQRVLLDCGIGVLPQITKLGLTVASIETIAISHFHADHFTLQPVLQAYFLEGKFSGLKPKLHILGPKGIKERVEIGFDQSGFSFQDDFLTNVEFQISEYDDQVCINLGSEIKLTPYKTKHYGLDAYALRLVVSNSVIAYSGDSTVSEGLKAASMGVDLFLCEASTRVGQTSDMGHVSALDAAKVAKEAGSKKLVLTHYSGFDLNENMLDEARLSGYEGAIDIADDLSDFLL